MGKVVDTIALARECLLFIANKDGGMAHYKSFHRFLVARVERERVWSRSRSFILAYTIVSALNGDDLMNAFAAIKKFETEIPFDRMSCRLVRKIVEAAIISDELGIAKRIVAVSKERCSTSLDIEASMLLISWREGSVSLQDRIDLNQTYFLNYPAYDEYFKGLVCDCRGDSGGARDRFKKCLLLAPSWYRELREDALRRLDILSRSGNEPG